MDNLKYRNPFYLHDYIKGKPKIRQKIKQKYYVFIDEIQLSETVKNPYIENSENITFVDTVLD